MPADPVPPVPPDEMSSTSHPRDAAALEFSMEPRKTMAELLAQGRAELRTCQSCGQKTPFPIDTPPCAIPLVCQDCGTPLVAVSPGSDVPADVVRKALGFRNRCLLHLPCPWCHTANNAVTAPANCVSGARFVVPEPENPRPLFRMQVDCVACKKEFWVEWDL